jgi:large subunit ribosomal protein L19
MAEEQAPQVPNFRTGDTVKVFYKIKEEGKERIQPFEGIIIAQKGAGNSKTITVRKLASLGIGVERIFPIFSPNIGKIEVTKHGKVRRSKLYYIREKLSTKAVKSR